MRKLMIALTGAAMLSIASIAYAAELTASITYVDIQARIIVIDHRAFHVPQSIDITILKVGEQVTIVFEKVDGQLRIVSIRIS
jgi:Cu/Ag efflux protein CusF